MIGSSYFWFNIFFLSIGTFCIRGFFIFLSSRIKISTKAKEVLSFIPAAILPAMVAPMVFYHQGQVSLLFGKERLLVLILSCVFCYLFKSMLATIIFGLALLYFVSNYV